MRIETSFMMQGADQDYGEARGESSLNLLALVQEKTPNPTPSPEPSDEVQASNQAETKLAQKKFDGSGQTDQPPILKDGDSKPKDGKEQKYGKGQPPKANDGISVTAMNALSIEQLRALSPADLLNAYPKDLSQLDVEKLRSLSPDQLNGLLRSSYSYAYEHDPLLDGMKGRPWWYGTKADDGYPQRLETRWRTASALWEMKPEQFSLLTDDQVKGLGSDVIRDLGSNQLAAFSIPQLRLLSADQLRGIEDYKLSQLSTDQARVFLPAQLEAMRPDARKLVELRAMTPSDIAALPVDKIKAMGYSELHYLTTQQIGALTDQQLRVLTREQFNEFSIEQFAAVKNVSGLTVSQLPRFYRFSPEQVQSLTSAQLKGLSTAQLEELARTHLTALFPDQLKAITKAQVDAIEEQNWAHKALTLRKLTPDEISRIRYPNPLIVWMAFYSDCLSPAQIAAVRPDTTGIFYGPALTVNQLAVMTPAQLQAIMKHTKPEDWKPEQRQILQSRRILP